MFGKFISPEDLLHHLEVLKQMRIWNVATGGTSMGIPLHPKQQAGKRKKLNPVVFVLASVFQKHFKTINKVIC